MNVQVRTGDGLLAPYSKWRILGMCGAQDSIEMQTILESLPLYSWATVETMPLSLHPKDSAIIKS
jgi:muconolactone delta-isomerase